MTVSDDAAEPTGIDSITARPRRLTLGRLAFGTAAVIGLLVVVALPRSEPAPPPLRPAPSFDLERLDKPGARLRLADYLGTPVLVNFWASWCVPCRQEMPELQVVADRYDGKLIVIGINMWDSAEEGRALLAELGVTYPTATDTDNQTVTAFDVNVVPSTAFVTADGRFAAIANGKPSDAELDDMIRQHLGLP